MTHIPTINLNQGPKFSTRSLVRVIKYKQTRYGSYSARVLGCTNVPGLK
uniref:Uncharacterized protein n=1 Tax=Arundo donax TaxID=35708 RepID=A0A0A8ZGS1_ARUDO